MTAPPQMNGGPPPGPGGMVQEDPAVGVNALLRALRVAAENAAGTQSGAEAKDYGAAALSFAQAIIVLDPTRSQGGTPLQHDIALKTIDGQTQQAVATIQGDAAAKVAEVNGQHALRLAKETAAATTPAKTKSVSVRRDAHGRASSYSVSEG